MDFTDVKRSERRLQGSAKLRATPSVTTNNLFLDNKDPHNVQDIDRPDVVHIVDEHSLEESALDDLRL